MTGATDHWADVFVRVLLVSGWAILLLGFLFMAIHSYITEKSGKPSSDRSIAAIMLSLWLLNNIALCVFGILSEWLSLAKWEIWATYVAAFLIGLVVWLISKREASKEDRNLVLISLLFLAALIIATISLVALFTGRY